MILRRSSSRCSRKLMARITSSGCSAGEASAVNSGIRGLSRGIQLRFGSWGGITLGSNRGARLRRRWKNSLARLFPFQLVDLVFYLCLELIGSALEFVQRFSDLPAYLWQLFRAKQDERRQKQKHHLWKTEIHLVMILPHPLLSNCPVHTIMMI